MSEDKFYKNVLSSMKNKIEPDQTKPKQLKTVTITKEDPYKGLYVPGRKNQKPQQYKDAKNPDYYSHSEDTPVVLPNVNGKRTYADSLKLYNEGEAAYRALLKDHKMIPSGKLSPRDMQEEMSINKAFGTQKSEVNAYVNKGIVPQQMMVKKARFFDGILNPSDEESTAYHVFRYKKPTTPPKSLGNSATDMYKNQFNQTNPILRSSKGLPLVKPNIPTKEKKVVVPTVKKSVLPPVIRKVDLPTKGSSGGAEFKREYADGEDAKKTPLMYGYGPHNQGNLNQRTMSKAEWNYARKKADLPDVYKEGTTKGKITSDGTWQQVDKYVQEFRKMNK